MTEFIFDFTTLEKTSIEFLLDLTPFLSPQFLLYVKHTPVGIHALSS